MIFFQKNEIAGRFRFGTSLLVYQFICLPPKPDWAEIST